MLKAWLKILNYEILPSQSEYRESNYEVKYLIAFK